MSTYEYTDKDGVTVVGMTNEEAPAMAAALLEAAGVSELDPEAWNASATPERLALYWLYQWQGLRKVQAEQDAEETADRAFRESDQRARGVNPEAFPWESLQPQERASWRSRRRAAWEFFNGTEATVPAYAADPGFEQLTDLASRAREKSLKRAPRVLNEGHPEPWRDTQWRSKGEARDAYYSIYFDGEYWVIDGRFDRVGRYYWVNIPDTFFPMTEVTE